MCCKLIRSHLHFEDGDTQKPRAAAGVSLVTLLRMFFGYKGALLWHMESAMGDTVFAPMYQVLARRGVHFNFFSRVVGLGLSANKTALNTVTISRQINLKVGSYDPLVLVKGLPSWPASRSTIRLWKARRCVSSAWIWSDHWAGVRGKTPAAKSP